VPSPVREGMDNQLSLPFPTDPDTGTDEPRFAAVEFLTIAEAAAVVRCCERTVRRAIDTGELRAGRLRGQPGSRGGFRIRRADLDAWMYGDGA
jgi:excisionase family DNA binding protein